MAVVLFDLNGVITFYIRHKYKISKAVKYQFFYLDNQRHDEGREKQKNRNICN